MSSTHSHLSDQELLLAPDGELPPARAEGAPAHLAGCWTCRGRKGEIEDSIRDFVHAYRGNLDPLLPSPAGPRALLKAQLAEMTTAPQSWRPRWSQFATLRYAGAALFLLFLGLLIYFGPAF